MSAALPNLRELSLKDNLLSVFEVAAFLLMPNLRTLSLARNPISVIEAPPDGFQEQVSL